MDFEQANQLADRISRGENSGLLRKLVQMCLPYLLYIKYRFGFRRISDKEVVEELAADAVSDGIAMKQHRELPFALYLRNDFRKRCREIEKIRRETVAEGFETTLKSLNCQSAIRVGAKWPPPDLQAERNEEKELFHKELENHGQLSRRVIYLRLKGSPYKEIAEVCGKTPGQSRSVFWDNFNKIRNNLRRRYMKEDDA